MEKVNISWLEKSDTSISQIYSNGLEFAFATKNEQCTNFVFCKDFLHDCVWSVLHKKTISPYGFRYDPKLKPIELNRARLLVTNSDDTLMENKIEGCQDFLNQIEKKLRIFRTKISKCENPPDNYKKSGVYLFRGSGMWLNSPPMISLYSLLIRLGFCHKIGDDFVTTMDNIQNGKTTPYQSNDKMYLIKSREGIDAILNLGYRKFFYKQTVKNYPNTVDMMTMHNHFGIVGFTQLFKNDESLYKPVHAEKVPKYWHRKKVKKLFDENIKVKKPVLDKNLKIE